MNFDRDAARAEGYTDEEIDDFLAQKSQPVAAEAPQQTNEANAPEDIGPVAPLNVSPAGGAEGGEPDVGLREKALTAGAIAGGLNVLGTQAVPAIAVGTLKKARDILGATAPTPGMEWANAAGEGTYKSASEAQKAMKASEKNLERALHNAKKATTPQDLLAWKAVGTSEARELSNAARAYDEFVKGSKQALSEALPSEKLGKALEYAKTIAPKTTTAAEIAGKTISKALGPVGAALSGSEAYNQYQKGNYGRAALSGAGALGYGTAALPFVPPMARAVGAGIGGLSDLGSMGLDYIQGREHGGDVGAGTYIVGENGPEVLHITHGGGYVTPSMATQMGMEHREYGGYVGDEDNIDVGGGFNPAGPQSPVPPELGYYNPNQFVGPVMPQGGTPNSFSKYANKRLPGYDKFASGDIAGGLQGYATGRLQQDHPLLAALFGV